MLLSTGYALAPSTSTKYYTLYTPLPLRSGYAQRELVCVRCCLNHQKAQVFISSPNGNKGRVKKPAVTVGGGNQLNMGIIAHIFRHS